ncbi:methionine synthase [Pseudonocardia sp. WMMC193]|uniref:methionine synthase n=1 Tax=Pseudonocardia sp. WMMC193 TaxID=2911965 RepID=UPI001F22BC05|nr:methionine synthase [Pseudonocardia sp. WMMC193]MCF7550305.1 methionine synthase [Pseudonocardia sp. WMMC193]
MTTPDDPMARILAAAGLAKEPAPPADDPLAAALAAAGLADAKPGVPVAPEPRFEVVEEVEVVERELGRWPAGAATGLGSLPGTDPRAAAELVAGELPLLPHLPELPARGVGADPVGRAAGMLVDLAVEVVPTGWRVTARPGRDHRRAVDLLRADLDAFDEACDRTRPDWVKVQVVGPWTLAAEVELAAGHRVLTDRGAAREFAASLTEGLSAHVAEVAARTGAQVVVQLDEPRLAAVVAGSLPTASGYGTVRAVPEPDAQDALRELITALDVPVVVRVPGDRPPLALLREVGASGLAVDATQRSISGDTAVPAALDAVGEVWDAGLPLFLGLVPTRDPGRPLETAELARRAYDLADRLGFDRVRLGELAVPTPAGGLARSTPEWSRRAMELCRDLAHAFQDPDELPPDP